MSAKNCPLCGAAPLEMDWHQATCSSYLCPMSGRVFQENDWNHLAHKVTLAEEIMWSTEVAEFYQSHTGREGFDELVTTEMETEKRIEQVLHELMEAR